MHYVDIIRRKSARGKALTCRQLVQGQVSPSQPEISPEGVSHLSQSKLLPLLMASAKTAPSKGTIQMGSTVKAVEQRAGSVSVLVQTEAVRVRTDGLDKVRRQSQMPGQHI